MTDLKEKARSLGEILREENFEGKISFDLPLAPLTYYRIGGPALIFIEPESTDDLLLARSSLGRIPMPVLLIGAGSNLLISDDGFPGAVIRLAGNFENYQADTEGNSIISGASASLSRIVREGCRIGMKGIERLAGIPGSVGGALFMNAGTYGEYIDGLVETVDILTGSNKSSTITSDDCGFAYRTSRFQETAEIILRCKLSGESGNPGEISAEVEKRLEHRRRTQPVDIPSCGCVFRNPRGEKSAGKLIDEAGLKGTRIGDAVISDKHANFIINEGNASANDILSLMALARNMVFERTGVALEPEVRTAGFTESIEVMLDEWPST